MKVFITGMAGTLGTALAVEHRRRGDEIAGCSRNELNGLKWRAEHSDLGHLYIADAFDLGKSFDAVSWLRGVDKLYHCAALKHVDVCEQQPMEAMGQNVELTDVIVRACKEAGVPVTLASTDKACRPDSVYGATKLLAERIVLNAGGTVVRLGNLIGSSGSVFQTWKEQLQRGEPITLTDPRMTRFFMLVKHAAQFMASVFRPGRYVPPLKSARMGLMAATMVDDLKKIKEIGLRPGETLHQWITDEQSSENAERWNVRELLQEVGVTI